MTRIAETFEERLKKHTPVWQVNEEQDRFWYNKQRRMRMEEDKKRMEEDKKRVNPGLMEMLNLDDLVSINREQLELQKASIPKNIPIYNELTLGVNDPVVHLDFASPGDTVDPQRRSFNLPSKPLFSLDIKNDGTGDIKVMWNHPGGRDFPVVPVPVKKNEKVEIRPMKHNIDWLKLVATSSSSSTVRLYGII